MVSSPNTGVYIYEWIKAYNIIFYLVSRLQRLKSPGISVSPSHLKRIQCWKSGLEPASKEGLEMFYTV